MLIALIVADYYFNISSWYYVLLIISFALLLFYGSYSIQSGFFMPVTCHGNINENRVAITFDDGPVESGTSVILDILNKNKVPAAFFCIGNKMKNEPALVKRIIDEGHIVGNHSYTHHFFFDLFPKFKMKDELDATNNASLEISNHKPRLFRPPYGVTTPSLASVVHECNMQPVGWSLRSMDTVTNDPEKLISKIENNVKPGDIILLHDTATVTVKSLQKIIDIIRKKGLEPVRLDQLLNTKAYA